MGGGQDFIRNIGRDPGYGLRQRQRSYRKGAQKPVGPRLLRGRGLLRRRRTLPADGYDAASPRLRCALCGEFVTDDSRACPECGQPLHGESRVRGWRAGQARRSQVARARFALLVVGIVLILWAGLRFATAAPETSIDPALMVGTVGVSFLALVVLAGSAPAAALGVGTLAFLVLVPVATRWLFVYGVANMAARVIHSVVPALGLTVMLGVLVALFSGWRAAAKLES